MQLVRRLVMFLALVGGLVVGQAAGAVAEVAVPIVEARPSSFDHLAAEASVLAEPSEGLAEVSASSSFVRSFARWPGRYLRDTPAVSRVGVRGSISAENLFSQVNAGEGGVVSPAAEAVGASKTPGVLTYTPRATPGVKTPYGVASQADDAASLAARREVAEGATIWPTGTTGKSQGAEGQFWTTEHPMSPGFAQRYGIPPENLAKADFIESAVVPPGSPFVTRPAPPVGTNKGGGIEVVVPERGVRMCGFSWVGPKGGC